MQKPRQAAIAAALLITGATRAASAQIDYRNLDDDRPTLVEDAYAIERYAFEWIIPYRLERGPGGAWVHAFIPELTHGVPRNGQIGFKLPIAGVDENGARDWGIAGLRLFALYNFNTESSTLPALALRADASLPVGSLGGAGTHAALKVVATRSWGRSRLHLNAAYSFGRLRAPPAVEALGRWWYGAGLDRTLFRQSALLVGEIFALREADDGPVHVRATLGLRYQWTPTTVLDVGLGRSLRSAGGPDYLLTFGLSRVFGVAALMPRGHPTTRAAVGGRHEHAH